MLLAFCSTMYAHGTHKIIGWWQDYAILGSPRLHANLLLLCSSVTPTLNLYQMWLLRNMHRINSSTACADYVSLWICYVCRLCFLLGLTVCGDRGSLRIHSKGTMFCVSYDNYCLYDLLFILMVQPDLGHQIADNYSRVMWRCTHTMQYTLKNKIWLQCLEFMR